MLGFDIYTHCVELPNIIKKVNNLPNDMVSLKCIFILT